MSNTNEFWIDLLKISYCNHIFLVVVVYATLSRCSRQKIKARASGEGVDAHLMTDCLMTVLTPCDTLGTGTLQSVLLLTSLASDMVCHVSE